MIKISFIWHDCFVVETDSAEIVFDFWKDPAVKENELPIFLQKRDSSKPLFVFVSHHHKDHYVKEIFSWTEVCDNIHYILSHDTSRFARHILSATSLYSGPRPLSEQVTVLKPGEKCNIGPMIVEAFGSTDIGNSYLAEIDGNKFFHAGDLNAWIWKDDSTEKEIEDALHAFSTIIESISSRYPEIDYAFFPVDSRIGTDYFTGASIFVDKIYVRRFFPMHFCLGDTLATTEGYMRDACDFQKYANRRHGEYIGLIHPYSAFMAPA